MKYKAYLLVSSLIIILVSCITLGVVLIRGECYNYSFEESFEGWVGDADYLVGENDSIEVDWNVTRSNERAIEGDYSVCLEFNGFHDDGGVWIEYKHILNNSGKVKIKVTFYIFSESFGMNTRAWFFGAITLFNPEIEDDFNFESTTICGDNEVTGWSKLSFSATLSNIDVIWISIGYRVAWETFLSFFIDEISIIVR
jgi:hypothetical protein